MKIRVEASGLQIGVDNAITTAMKNNEWGLRFSFQDEDYKSRAEFVLNFDAVKRFELKLEEELKSAQESEDEYLWMDLPILDDCCKAILSVKEVKELQNKILSAKEEIAKFNQIIK